jgi:hypothetical protein
MTECTGSVQFMGKDAPVFGNVVKVGQVASEFSAYDRKTRRFNQEDANLSREIAIIVVSMDRFLL